MLTNPSTLTDVAFHLIADNLHTGLFVLAPRSPLPCVMSIPGAHPSDINKSQRSPPVGSNRSVHCPPTRHPRVRSGTVELSVSLAVIHLRCHKPVPMQWAQDQAENIAAIVVDYLPNDAASCKVFGGKVHSENGLVLHEMPQRNVVPIHQYWQLIHHLFHTKVVSV